MLNVCIILRLLPIVVYHYSYSLTLSFFLLQSYTHIGNTLEDGENPMYKVPLQVENINGNLMITILFNNNTDGEDTPVDIGSAFICCCHQYNDNMITRKVHAKSKISNNEQIKGLTSHIIVQLRELTALK